MKERKGTSKNQRKTSTKEGKVKDYMNSAQNRKINQSKRNTAKTKLNERKSERMK